MPAEPPPPATDSVIRTQLFSDAYDDLTWRLRAVNLGVPILRLVDRTSREPAGITSKDEDVQQVAVSPPAPVAGPFAQSERERASVLVVEDDPTLLSTLAYNLSREGYRVLTAADGESGLALAQREDGTLDLVVLDIMLPGINGFQVLRQICAPPRTFPY